MNTSTRIVLLMTLLIPFCACSHRGIPKSELADLRRLAFDEATKRYALTDAAVESQYNREMAVPCPQEKPNKSYDPFSDFRRCEDAHRLFRVQAVASVKGVQLSPLTHASSYLVKFDFEPSSNPHTKPPESKATAERFERPDGTHYWVISWQ